MTSEATCPGEDAVLSFLEGVSTASERARFDRHADACHDCAFLVARRRTTGSGRGASDRALTVAVLSPGDVVAGRYAVEALLGAGGMGEVYQVLDRTLNEPAALKTVRARWIDDEAAVARLKSEVQLARRVTHPNICRIFDFGVHTDTAEPALVTPFLTMELLRGTTLARRLQRAVPIETALDVAQQLTRGLEAAHQAGIVHKDFKSDNIILVGADDRLRAVITDFGLAATCNDEPRLLATGAGFSGTPGYVAPERMNGGAATRASDVFALGVVLLDMLTGRIAGRPGAPLREELAREPRARSLLRIAADCCVAEPAARPDVPAVAARLERLRRRGPAAPAARARLERLRRRGPAAPAPRARLWRIALPASAAVVVTLLALALRGSPGQPPRPVAAAQPGASTAAPLGPPAEGVAAPVPAAPPATAAAPARPPSTRTRAAPRRRPAAPGRAAARPDEARVVGPPAAGSAAASPSTRTADDEPVRALRLLDGDEPIRALPGAGHD